jgi:hypothetical protein
MTKNIAEQIFLNMLEEMKLVLDLGEYKLGADKKAYTYFKRVVMDIFYDSTRKLLVTMEKDGKITQCKCDANLRHGYTQCPQCHGAGYVNVKDSEQKARK